MRQGGSPAGSPVCRSPSLRSAAIPAADSLRSRPSAEPGNPWGGSNVKNNAPLVNFRRLQVPTPWWVVLLVLVPYLVWYLTRAVVRLVPVVRRNWCSLALAIVAGWLWYRQGWVVLVLVLVAVTGAGGLWWWRRRASCERLVVLPLLAWWRRISLYQLHWREALTLCKLAERFDDTRIMPRLLRVRCTVAADEVLLRMPRGQNPDLYHKASANLAYSFNARECRV